MDINIKHKYVDVATEGGHHFYGGSQLLFDGMIKHCGCSLIAAADVILYMTGCREPISVENYKQYVKRLAPAFPFIPYRGIPGVVLSLYLNLYLRLRRLPFHARFSGLSLINGSLKSDMPVILCIGPGVHQFLKPKAQRGVMLYTDKDDSNAAGHSDAASGIHSLDSGCRCGDMSNDKGNDKRSDKCSTKSDTKSDNNNNGNNMHRKLTGELTPVKRVRSHFVVVTAADGDLLTVSSWGTRYYIRLSELRRYATLDLCGIFTNVITLHFTKSVITRS